MLIFDEFLQRTVAVLAATVVTAVLTSAWSLFRLRRFSRFLSGEYFLYWAPLVGIAEHPFYSGKLTIRYRLWGPIFSGYPLHNVVIKHESVDLSMSRTCYAKIRRDRNMVELSEIDFNTNMTGHWLLCIPDHLNLDAIGGIYTGIAIVGVPGAWPEVLSRTPLAHDEVVTLLNDQRSIKFSPDVFFTAWGGISRKRRQSQIGDIDAATHSVTLKEVRAGVHKH